MLNSYLYSVLSSDYSNLEVKIILEKKVGTIFSKIFICSGLKLINTRSTHILELGNYKNDQNLRGADRAHPIKDHLAFFFSLQLFLAKIFSNEIFEMNSCTLWDGIISQWMLVKYSKFSNFVSPLIAASIEC